MQFGIKALGIYSRNLLTKLLAIDQLYTATVRQLWVDRVGNCPPRFWQNRRYRQALTAHCITIFPLSFRKLLTSLIYVWIEPKKCNLVSAYTEEIHANKSSFISKLVPIGKVSTRYFYENRVFAPFPLREIAVQVCRCISWNN